MATTLGKLSRPIRTAINIENLIRNIVRRYKASDLVRTMLMNRTRQDTFRAVSSSDMQGTTVAGSKLAFAVTNATMYHSFKSRSYRLSDSSLHSSGL
jgi:hypothetical protein